MATEWISEGISMALTFILLLFKTHALWLYIFWLLFVAHAACISVMRFIWAMDPTTFWQGEAPVPMWLFSGTFMDSDTSTTPASLLLHGSPSPTFTERQTSTLFIKHYYPTCSSLVVLSFSFFKSSLNLFQWIVITPVPRPFSPFGTCVLHLSPAGLMLCKLFIYFLFKLFQKN